jgi:ubiquinone/menaquinone biosynthesis C-methylase UbiE
MAKNLTKVERETGNLFGELFPRYNDELFIESVELFKKRFEANNFDTAWFKGKLCLDMGCGGGRYSIALSLLGAKRVSGIDISKKAVIDARKRATKLKQSNLEFKIASCETLPFKGRSFDFVVLSGVLHHLVSPEKAIKEIVRVLQPGGLLYMLVYATGGVRWPLIQILRPIAQFMGFRNVFQAASEANLPANKVRTYLDDLFVPIIDFYSYNRLTNLLRSNGFSKIERWERGRFDHEEDLNAYYKDLKTLRLIFKAGRESQNGSLVRYRELFKNGEKMCSSVLQYVSDILNQVQKGDISEREGVKLVIGQGHSRVLAWKDTN